jgi:aryl-alcohol dehydrogenase-like predicted oxidoreductase
LHADEAARRLGVTPFVSAQNEFSLLTREAETGIIPVARDLGLGFLPFFPLYNGLFTGKFDRNGGPADSRIMRIRQYLHAEAPWDTMDALTDFARSRDLTMLEATIGWLLAVPGLSSVIAGVTSVEQIRENAAAATAWSPTPAEFDEVSELFAV